ncbi:HupE/UreJ family protein [Aphanothece microscopica]|uniref:HupE/UreJ family protein n=1 Tax=Aphanothece microscopica TaxID=1049561 RepID=UPI003CE4C1FD
MRAALRLGPAAGLLVALLAAVLRAQPAQAHHLVEINALQASPLNGLISGLLHPVLGPDHLIFLLALSLVGLRHRRGWMLGLLGVGLLGSGAGLIAPGLPGAELITAATIALVGLVLLGRLPVAVLLPAMAMHGYVLSGPVLGWSAMPVAFYAVGLLLSQAALLLLALAGLRSLVERLSPARLRWMGIALLGAGAVLARASFSA